MPKVNHFFKQGCVHCLSRPPIQFSLLWWNIMQGKHVTRSLYNIEHFFTTCNWWLLTWMCRENTLQDWTICHNMVLVNIDMNIHNCSWLQREHVTFSNTQFVTTSDNIYMNIPKCNRLQREHVTCSIAQFVTTCDNIYMNIP